MKQRVFASAAVIVGALGLVPSPRPAAAIDYSFSSVADSSGPLQWGTRVLSVPKINDNAQVAFWARLDEGGEAILLGATSTRTIADTTGPYGSLAHPDLSNLGTVVFYGRLDDGVEGIYAGANPALDVIADTTGPFTTFQGGGIIETPVPPSINNHDVVAFFARKNRDDLNQASEGIYTGPDPNLHAIVDNAKAGQEGNYSFFEGELAFSHDLNDAGVAAFQALAVLPEIGFTNGIFTGPDPTQDQIVYWRTMDGEVIRYEAVGAPTINGRGQVAFSAYESTRNLWSVLVGDGESLETVADTAGEFVRLDQTSINDAGNVAFSASLSTFEQSGIFRGPDPVADKVIQPGDPLFGSVATTITMGEMNNAGQISFYYKLRNQVEGIAVASPILTVAGDFDANGLLTAVDMDLLAGAVRDRITNPIFDLDGDGLATQSDRALWVTDLAGTWFGDADLNGAVEFDDFALLSENFGKPGGWGQGDFDGDGEVQFADFLTLSSNYGNSAAAAAVPEPSFAAMLCGLFGGMMLGFRRRRRGVAR